MNSKSVTHGGVTGSVCDVCVCEWGTQPLKRTQQWCWFLMRAWENVFSETFLSTSTNAWSWAFCLNQKCNEGGPNGFLLKLLEILCILCRICSLWKILRTIMLPELSFRQNAWFLAWFSVTESQSHPQKGHLLFENVEFFVWIEQRLDSIYSKHVVSSYVWKGLTPFDCNNSLSLTHNALLPKSLTTFLSH